MLGWLLLFSFLLAALFIYLGTGGEDLAQTSAIGIAAAVAFVLLALYAISTRGGHDGHHRPRRFLVPILLAAGVGAWMYLSPNLDIAAWLQRAGASKPSDDMSGLERRGLKSIMIRRDARGQFTARGAANGTPIDLLIDTGASTVLLRQSDAERAGIDTTSLDYSVPIQTANGQHNAAAVRLRSLAIGVVRIDDVEALVAQPGSLNENLLGMSFLRRLRSYEISGDFMTLRE